MGILPQASKQRLSCIPDLDSVDIRPYQLFQVCGQGSAIDLGAAPGRADALGDVEDNASEPILIDVDLLVIGNLSELAVCPGEEGLARSAQHEIG